MFKKISKVSLARQLMEARIAEPPNRWNKSDTCTDSPTLPVDKVKMCTSLARGNKVTMPKKSHKGSNRLLAVKLSCTVTTSVLICRMMVKRCADLVLRPASREVN